MRQFLLFVLVLTTAGCQSSRGGLTYRKSGRADDPMYSIEEQERRGRERLGVVEDYTELTPKVYVDRPGVSGR